MNETVPGTPDHDRGSMKTRRLTLPVQEARPAMRLAADVRNASGGILLAAQAELTAESLAGLLRRGIDIVIVDILDTRTAEEIARELEQAEARIDHLFRRHIDDPEMLELKQAVLDYRRKALA
jgi:hypothetical protein